jgi:hypothetical protein
MKLHFPWSGIETLLTEVITAKTVRPLFDEQTGKGLWLVGDQGVYLMANTTDGEINSKPKPDNTNAVVYADECDPTRMAFEDWWANKRRSFGNDDGVEFIPLLDFITFRRDDPTHLVVDFTDGKLGLTTITRKTNG